jgi:hypothetical protein
MAPSHVRLLVAVVLVLLVSLATADRRVAMLESVAADATPASERIADDGAEAPSAAEIARIRTHLMRVEDELLAANVAHLTVAQRENRAQHITTLREYRNRGLFPHNHQVLGQRVPVFVDDHGTHCAVGYLIAQSGHDDLARQIASTRNLARVPDLADIPELVAWLEDAGLSVEEAARIQPAYDGWPGFPERVVHNGYAPGTALMAAVGGGVSVWNLFTDRQGSGWWLPGAAGIGAGTAGIALAAYGIGLNEDSDGVADIETSHILINAGIGLISGILGVRTIGLGRAAEPALGDDGGPPALQLSAWTPAEGGGAGVRIGLRF